MLNCQTPSTSLKPFSTADVHAPQVIPSIATVVLLIFCRDLVFRRPFPCVFCGASTLVSTMLASKPVSSMISAIREGESRFESCSITARSDRRDMLNDLIPATFLKAPSTADVHAPQVMPPTDTVVTDVPVSRKLTVSSSEPEKLISAS